jgi:hypothetical protein
MRCSIILTLVCLCCLVATASQAVDDDPIIRVPGDVATLPEAIAMAHAGNIIELAPGHHAIVGRGYQLEAGLTIRAEEAVGGACILHEVPAYEGDWRQEPVFILDRTGRPCRIEGLVFEGWNLGNNPLDTYNNPIIQVDRGQLHAVDCRWFACYKNVVRFQDGRGLFENCRFEYGAGCPSAIDMRGGELLMEGCQFHHNVWISDCAGLHGSILSLCAGKTKLVGCELTDNGPLVNVLTVGEYASLYADQTCFGCNDAIHEAEVAGCVCLHCCLAHPMQWVILEGGTLVLDKPLTDDKAMAHELKSWSAVKSAFD